jgi:LysR family nitrogen assimilation transcriptional regulator
VVLKFADGDSESLEERIVAKDLDMAVVFEDELVPVFARVPLFRQRLFFVSSEASTNFDGFVRLDQIALLPLVLPSFPNGRRRVVDRAFSEAGLTPNVIAETDTLSSELSAVRTGLACSIMNMSTKGQNGFADPLLIEPPVYLTCSVISSSDFPLTHAGEAVRDALIQFVNQRIQTIQRAGAEWIGPSAD